MTKFFILIFIALGFINAQDIELVESIPVETNLDNPDIRNTQEVWLEMINGAKLTLDIEQFYISNEKGEALNTVINAIVSAGERGVKVRIIVDAGMYKTYPETVDWLGKQKNIEVVKFDVKSLTGGIQHAKFFIVDNEQVFLGSQNFDWRALNHIHEIGVRIKHKGCSDFFERVFKMDWEFVEEDLDRFDFEFPETNKFIFPHKDSLSSFIVSCSFTTTSKLLFVASGDPRGRRNIFPEYLDNEFDDKLIISLINSAKSEITLQFLSYHSKSREGSYWGALDSSLINAVNRGVKIKMIISDWNLSKDDVETFLMLQENPNIEIKYSSIPEWSGGYIPYARVEHCKFITIDGKSCWIGTSNAEKSYFYNSRNVGIVIENEKFTTRLRDIFYKSWNSEYTHPIMSEGEYKVCFHSEQK